MRLNLLIAAVASTMALGSVSAENLTGTLEKVRDTNRLAIGFQEASIPFSYLDGDQKPVGFAIDICLKIAEAVRQELDQPDIVVDFVPATSANRIPLLINGTIDLNCAATTNSAERQKQIGFTNTHFLTASRFVSKKDANLNTIDDLKDKAVTSVSGSTNINQVNKVNADRKLGMRVVPTKDQMEAFLMLETDRAQAYVMDDVQLAVAIARSSQPDLFVISDDAFSKAEPYGVMLRRDDTPFQELVDRVTAELFQSDEIETLYSKWFQSPVPPNGINFNYPMPDALRKAYQNPQRSHEPDDYHVD